MPRKNDIFVTFARKPTVRIPTNVLILDILLGGGIPIGDYVELCSESSLGKSTLTLQIMKQYAKLGGWVLILDFEQGITEELIDSIGLTDYIKDESIRILQPITYGDGEEILDSLNPEDLPSIVLIDSITSMLIDPELSVKKDGTKNRAIGLKSRCESDFLIKYKGFARKNGITFIFINQVRTKFTKSFRAYTDSAGGNALRFYCDLRLFMRKTQDLVRREQTLSGIKDVIYGNTVEMVARKNRGNRSFIGVPLDIIHGKGISNYKSVANVLISSGLVKQSGSYFKILIEDEINVQGWKGLLKYVKENYAKLRILVKEKGLLKLTNGEEVRE